MSKIMDINRLREHNHSSLVITLTEPARELGLEKGDFVKIVKNGSKLQLIPVKEEE